MDPFFRRLPTLTSGQKAAAVHLGIFPDSGVSMASASPGADRLASIEQLLIGQQQQQQPQAAAQSARRYTYAAPAPAPVQQQLPVQLASVSTPQIKAASPNNELIQTQRIASAPGTKKIWLQLAAGKNPTALRGEFREIRSREPSLFEGINGYIADEDARSRLVIGPFHTVEDARLFADALESVRIRSFRWVSPPGQVVRKLPPQ
jgi:hypothetical protein